MLQPLLELNFFSKDDAGEIAYLARIGGGDIDDASLVAGIRLGHLRSLTQIKAQKKQFAENVVYRSRMRVILISSS